MTTPVLLKAQILYGRVYIAGTETAVANASVYYNASTTGTATNNNGDFTLPENADHIPLIVSCVGYSTQIINNYDAKNLLKIFLMPKTQVLHEIVIESDGMSRKEKEKIFLEEFLGTSSFAKGCTITNLNDVELTYHTKTQLLTASCNKPLQIDNKPLGYHISYFLQEFTYNTVNVYFSGNYYYKDNFTPAEQSRVFKNREKAYTGSRLQFIRALWADELEKKHFEIYFGYFPANRDSIIRIDSGRRFVSFKKNILRIYYHNNLSQLAQTAPSLITNTGYYGPGLHWYGGTMSDQRIGDNLPFEYWPEEEKPSIPKHP